ncbi:porin [Bacteroidia bacterium]|nr:porin [Bacteroidia bacterium]
MGLVHVIRAQETENVNTRLERIENITAKLPAISGTVNLRYRYDDATGSNSMDIRRARLNFKGGISSKVEYRLQLEFAKSPKALDVIVKWKINPFLHLQAGQFHTPFALENQYAPQKLESIEYSLVISHLSGYSDEVSGISAFGRDMGIQLAGGFFQREGYTLLDYAVGLFNGSGINTTDNNQSKDFSGMLSVHPVKPLTIAVFHYNGSTGAQNEEHQRVRSGVGLRYDDGKFLFRGEYIQGISTDAAGEYWDSEGFYALAGYCFAQKVQPVVKYDYWHKNKTDHNNLKQEYLVGVNYFPVKRLLLQVNYSYRQNIGMNDSRYMGIQLCGLF